MKRIIFLLLFALLNIPSLLLSEEEPLPCPMDMTQVANDPIPNYLQPWWDHVRRGYFAVVYVDFPDGRYINGNDTLQPFYDWQLEWVNTNAEIDAAGEMGLTLQETNIQTTTGNKYVKASKYTYYDRWNMFFDSVGSYVGTIHPDWSSNGDSAWGSFKEYWKQASNSKFELIPYLTHPNESNYKLRTGIVNNYEMINGQPIIKCIKMRKKKYGSDSSNSYFRAYTGIPPNTDYHLNIDAIAAITEQTDFDLTEFRNNGGILFVYFAGSHGSFIDGTDGLHREWISPIRGRENMILNGDSRIDGFGVSAHQYGHMKFNWSHTKAGRCDIMNGHDVHDNNSPEFPNPIYRMLEGWLQPIALESTDLDTLPPIETSYKCGVITMFGKPSGVPDWGSGESFVVENRRRLNFDRFIVDRSILNQTEYRDFNGGLLVWHYSPYYSFNTELGNNGQIAFHQPDTAGFVISNRG